MATKFKRNRKRKKKAFKNRRGQKGTQQKKIHRNQTPNLVVFSIFSSTPFNYSYIGKTLLNFNAETRCMEEVKNVRVWVNAERRTATKRYW